VTTNILCIILHIQHFRRPILGIRQQVVQPVHGQRQTQP
jgi:hypothetical protein